MWVFAVTGLVHLRLEPHLLLEPRLLLLAPLSLGALFVQLYLRKLEGTLRIAAYLRVFVAPRVPGLGWEGRLAGPPSATLGAFGPHWLFAILTAVASYVACEAFFSWYEEPHYTALLAVALLVYTTYRIQTFRLGVPGFERRFRDTAGREADSR